jgi:tetratricopeptide (TPR) repeat protein
MFDAAGQPTLSFDLKKPKKFENKKLGSEKSAEKKFTFPRKVIQNTVTHYNWHFNAQNKLTGVIERAKAFHRDDFSELLPFYNYTLDITQRDSSELDSVIYKANAGILIHDLRNAWIDNLYMLMGTAYFYKKEFDSAYLTFQYINYAYAPKEEDGYDIPIGSNATEGGNAFSISTKENNSIVKKAFSTPPSRNESLVWQIRTNLENDELAEAAGLIETLKNDPIFPARLKTDLEEVQAYWFYKQHIYDSAAIYLERALPNAGTKNERARWEYLIAQLYEKAGKSELAKSFYEKSIRHTVDPIMEVYVRLNAIRQNKGDSNAIKINVAQLVKMARKDRYSRYRDIIYYTAAQIELERNNIDGAKALLLRAAKAYNPNNASTVQRSKAYLQLGDLSFQQQMYPDAQRFYDSVNTADPVIENPEKFEARKMLLAEIVQHVLVIERQDSLLRLAAMPEAEREAFIKKMVRQIRKTQGIKEDESTENQAPGLSLANREAPTDLFGTPQKGEWYFYNPSLKSKGYTAFKGKWGNRPNVDNWRRIAEVNTVQATGMPTDSARIAARPLDAMGEFSYEALLKNVPLTQEQLSITNDSIENSTVSLGRLYMEGLEDYPLVINTLDSFPEQFPYSARLPEALYYLYYSYKQLGRDQDASAVLDELQSKYAGTDYERKITNAVSGNPIEDQKTEMNRRYDMIYNLFIEGKFEEALAEKLAADTIFGNNYWTPQLLYIESIYHIRQRNDDQAKAVLQQLVEMFPDSPMKEKAETLMDVLSRRKEIENYLTNLQIERPAEDSLVIVEDEAAPQPVPPVQQPDVVQNQPDTTQQEPPADTVTVEEPDVTTVTPRKDTTTAKPPIAVKRDTVQAKPPVAIARNYTFNAAVPHYVVMITSNVDPVYVTESRNAFNRYNQANYYNKPIEISNQSLTDTTKMVVMSGFENAADALAYYEKTSKVAGSQIIPWLPAGKYSFIIISPENLELLKTRKSINEYRQFLNDFFPGKF